MSDCILSYSELENKGFPWWKHDRPLPPAAMKSNILCRRHNSMMGRLDEVGFALYKVTYDRWEQSVPSMILLNGHDLQRWILLRTAAFHFSKSFARFGVRVTDYTLNANRLVRDLFHGPSVYGSQLFLAKVLPENRDNYGYAMTPYFNPRSREVAGVRLVLNGLGLGLLIDPQTTLLVEAGPFRPQEIRLVDVEPPLRILLSWREGVQSTRGATLHRASQEMVPLWVNELDDLI